MAGLHDGSCTFAAAPPLVGSWKLGHTPQCPDSMPSPHSPTTSRYDAEAPECAPIPDFETRLTKFQRCCVVKAFREDRTLIAATDFIAEALGQRFVDSVVCCWGVGHWAQGCMLALLLARPG